MMLAIALLLSFAFFREQGTDLAAQASVPDVDQGIVATFDGGEVELTGSALGPETEPGGIAFEYGVRQQFLPASAPEVLEWSNTSIRFVLPSEIQSGFLNVVTAQGSSEPVELLVYHYELLNLATSTSKLPVALASGPDGVLWLNPEYHREIKAIEPSTGSVEELAIPQAPGVGIFADIVLGDHQSRTSGLGEDIDVDAEGNVWFTEGGGFLYDGEFPNASRVVRYDPEADSFSCYTSPVDNAQVIGVLVDEARDLVWYTEGGADGDAISAFDPQSASNDCLYDPSSGQSGAPLCAEGAPITDCHRRFELHDDLAFPAHLVLDGDGNVWFTELFGNRITRLDPETGTFSSIQLGKPAVPNLVDSVGPWEIDVAADGSLWASTYLDGNVLRVNPSDPDQCGVIDADGTNPCVEEFSSPAMVGATAVHSVLVGQDGSVWFGAEFNRDGSGLPEQASVGFVSTEHDDQVVLLPAMDGVRTASGIAQDPESGEVWVAEFASRQIIRLRQVGVADVDDDGVADAKDNCVVQTNATQQDTNGDGLGDACDPNDVDRDGCGNQRELGEDPSLGGLRNPEVYWDFYDVPDASGMRDRAITAGDLFGVVARVFTGDSQGAAHVNRSTDPLSPVTPTGYHPAFDRSRRTTAPLWQTGPADGAINAPDVFALLSQFGHRC
jgi:streptogramin lyase